MSGATVFDVAGAAEVVRPGSAEELASELARARAARRTVLPAGQGSRLGALGVARTADVVLSTERIGRILEYEPADLTITVEAGCPLAELDRVLAERGQVLPLQPGRARGTVGGLVAAAPEGATALAYGNVRDRLTGLRVALAEGTIVRGGGRVVKNVAGYGMHRLMAGSHGTLGVIVEASFKVQPRPEAVGSVLFTFDGDGGAVGAAPDVIASGLEPVFVDILLGMGPSWLVVGFEGTGERVAAHLERVGDIVAPWKPLDRRVLSKDEDERLRRTLDDWTSPDARLPERAGGPPVEVGESRGEPPVRAVLRLADRPSRIPQAAQLARGASMRAAPAVTADVRTGTGAAFVRIDAESTVAAVSAVRAALDHARKTSSAVVLAAPPEVAKDIDVWGPPPPDFFLMTRIKQALDPEGVFASGGFVGGL